MEIPTGNVEHGLLCLDMMSPSCIEDCVQFLVKLSQGMKVISELSVYGLKHFSLLLLGVHGGIEL